MTNFKGENCFVIGGKDKEFMTKNSVSRYNILNDKWEPGTPKLSVGRHLAAACSLGDSIFTFAGVNARNKYLNSVEMLKVPRNCNYGVAWYEASWELIQLPKTEFAPRRNPVVIPLNDSEIAILGGCGENDKDLSDVVVFNVVNKECRKVADGGDLKFTSDNNQIALIGGKVIALVFEKDDIPCLIEWSKGQ